MLYPMAILAHLKNVGTNIFHCVVRLLRFKILPSTEPFIGTVIMLLAPHPSWLYVLVDFHLQTVHQPFIFTVHILVTYTLTFMIFSSLIVCVTRDPGHVHPISELEGGGDGEEMDLTEALMPDRDFDSPGRWCRKCWVRGKIRTHLLEMKALITKVKAPKPERAHHCSACGRCVLKMGI